MNSKFRVAKKIDPQALNAFVEAAGDSAAGVLAPVSPPIIATDRPWERFDPKAKINPFFTYRLRIKSFPWTIGCDNGR